MSFEKSSPYHLKVSIACLHVMGVLYMVVPNIVQNRPNMPSSSSTPMAPTPTKVTFLGMDLWETIQPPPIQQQNASNNNATNSTKTYQDVEFVSPYIPYDPWVKWFVHLSNTSNGSSKLAHACIVPLGIVCIALVASMLPGVAYQGRFSKICKVMVCSVGFLVTCVHMAMNMCIRVLGGAQDIPRYASIFPCILRVFLGNHVWILMVTMSNTQGNHGIHVCAV